MIRYLLHKIALLVPTIFGISLAAFAFVRLLPGDPILALAGERGVSPERYAELIERFGYNRSYVVQYLDYIGNVLTGDFGISIATKRPVWGEFAALFPATLELATVAMIIAVAIGIPAGIFAAVKRGSWFDQATMGVALTGYSMPIFWWGLLLIISLFRLSRLDARLRPYRDPAFLQTGDRLHADRQSDFRPPGRFHLCRKSPHPAIYRSGDDSDGGDRPANPVRDARGSG